MRPEPVQTPGYGPLPRCRSLIPMEQVDLLTASKLFPPTQVPILVRCLDTIAKARCFLVPSLVLQYLPSQRPLWAGLPKSPSIHVMDSLELAGDVNNLYIF